MHRSETTSGIWDNLSSLVQGSPLAVGDVNPHDESIRELLDEIPDQFQKDGVRTESEPSSDYEITGRGAPGKFSMASLGPRGRAFFSMECLMHKLRRLAGAPVRLNEDCSCYLDYDRPGDYTAVHRDAEGCEATVLLYLEIEAAESRWPFVRIYPNHRTGPIVDPKGAPLVRDPIIVESRPGRLLMMVGSELPHERPPLLDGQRVLAAAACYRLEA